MAFYEHVFIARQDVNTSQVETMTADLSSIIEENGGRVAKSEYWGLKSLAYRIKKNRKGHYVMINIDAPHAAVAEMERQARLNEDIIRSMTIRVEDLEEGPSIVLRSKNDKEQRRGPRRDDAPRRDDSRREESKGE